MWQQWINGLLGIWIIVTAFVTWTYSGLRANLIITGIIIAILGFWGAGQYGAYQSPRRPPESPPPGTSGDTLGHP